MPRNKNPTVAVLRDIHVRSLQINYKAQTLTRTKRPVDRHILYQVMSKYYSGVPVAYIALQFDITMEQVYRIIEVGKYRNTKFIATRMLPQEYYAESVQFFLNLNTPVHVITKLYNTNVDELVDYIQRDYWRMRYWYERATWLYKYHAQYRYLRSPVGMEVLKKIKEMIKWK